MAPMFSQAAVSGIFCGIVLLGCAAADAQAQPVYRIVGPDGKVTFSDKPPQEAKTPSAPVSTAKPTDARSGLPYELQQLANKYPVTLYSASGCSPCDQGRALLTKRGVPFTEKTVNTNEDLVAFKRVSTEGALPLLTIGGQSIKGYSDGEWTSYLDAAGYPKQSALPPSYRQAAAEPLSPLKTAAQAPAPAVADSASNPTTSGDGRSAAPQRQRPVVPSPANNANNPAGIRF